MLDKAFKGEKRYWRWVLSLLGVMAVGFSCWGLQLDRGLTITGLSRDVSWGLYIAQFTFLVGVAASAVMVVLPYYLHNVKAFGKITIIGEFLAVAAVTMCMLFIVVDLGKPMRMLNVIALPDSQFRPVLGYGRPQWLSIPEHHHRLECSGGGKQGCASTQVGEASDLPVDPLGRLHSYGDRLPVRRFAGQALLVDRHPGRPLSGLGVLLRPRAARS